ncbi:MAG: helix-turn-helix domain-containing protein [Asgard group archaeon]|nr:helix-turn-helix domain-containing protein [Asgard group archaeon]
MSSESENVMKALSSSKRREMMNHISEKGSATYTELMEVLGFDQSMSGTFNYHLKELNEAGLIERTNGDYTITDAGKKALIFVDEIARETKEEARADRFGVFSAVLAIQPASELNLFISQMGMLLAMVISFIGVFGIVKLNMITRMLHEKIGDNVVWIGGIVLAIGLLLFIVSLVYFIRIIMKLKLHKVGLSLFLFLGREWFLIRSPNRGRYFILSITSIGAIACLGVITFSFKPAPWLALGIGCAVFTILTIVLFFLIKRRINMKEKENE